MNPKVVAVSISRYRGGARERRLYGGQGTITTFSVWFLGQPDTQMDIDGHGAMPSTRKADAIQRFLDAWALKNREVFVIREVKP